MNFHEKVIPMSTGSLAVFVCEGCGCMILHNAEDLNAHTKFHESFEQTASRAAFL